MENSPWLWAKGLGESKKLKKSQQEWQKNFAEMGKGFCFKQSSLIATGNY